MGADILGTDILGKDILDTDILSTDILATDILATDILATYVWLKCLLTGWTNGWTDAKRSWYVPGHFSSWNEQIFVSNLDLLDGLVLKDLLASRGTSLKA